MFDLLPLFLRNVAEHIFHFMHDTVVSLRGRKFHPNGIEHSLVAITDPESNFFDPRILRSSKRSSCRTNSKN